MSIDERITAAISEAKRPLLIGELRARCRLRNATLYERLTALTDSGQIVRSPEGYRLANRP
jgi:DNA-binding IclR family transcriptional regulator